MNLGRYSLLALLVLALCTFAAVAFAAGEPDVGDARLSDHGPRVADSGEMVYRCATDERGPKHVITPEMKAQIDRYIAENRIAAGGVIPVQFHVIYSASEGNVPSSQLDGQITVLNRNYGGLDYNGNPVSGAANTGYTFVRAGANWTKNSKWFKMTPGSAAESQAKNALAVSPGSALNIYLCKPGQSLLGWAVFPWDSRAGGKLDGVVLHYGSLPDGYLSPYNLGGTATHEVGHYLGLYHTFQGGCTGGDTTPGCTTGGDLVCDTPAEATATSGCPAGKNTCTGGGLDPIQNYMDYSTDICYTNFTAGQDSRMNTIVNGYRGWIGSVRIANAETPEAPGHSGDVDHGPRVVDTGEMVYRCATDERGPKQAVTPEMRAQIDRWIAESRFAAGGVITVRFHVIYSGSTGNVPESQLDAQIAVLNYNYAGKDYNGNPVAGAANTGYTFVKGTVDRTNNRKWFTMTPGSRNEQQAKSSLGVNQTSSLNLYTCKPGQNLLGWATFPWSLAGNPTMDGVVIHYGSVPGGYLSPYNLGGSATHEVGHWIGLYHTFQGGCTGGDALPGCENGGDYVCDTPAEATATSGCPTGKNTCSSGGVDPIHNYMDYSTDICYTNFTTGQDVRADGFMATYRPLVGSARIATNAAGSLDLAREASGDLALKANPNPFNPRTKIQFATARDGHVSVRVFDIQGRLAATVVDGRISKGQHSYEFNGDRLSSGVYMMVLNADGRQVVKRLSLLK
jgi:hypothetical protein